MWKVDSSLYLEDSEACGCLQYSREWISNRADGILGTEMERYGRHDGGLLEMGIWEKACRRPVQEQVSDTVSPTRIAMEILLRKTAMLLSSSFNFVLGEAPKALLNVLLWKKRAIRPR